jgi:hypothetical protein
LQAVSHTDAGTSGQHARRNIERCFARALGGGKQTRGDAPVTILSHELPVCRL